MDFFARQDIARRKTRILVLYFILAVVLIVAAVNGVFFLFYLYHQQQLGNLPQYQSVFSNAYWQLPYWIYISLATLAVILFGNLKLWYQLRDGGHSVASLSGASKVDLSSSDPLVRRYINVVEEMSIASGVVMPTLYIAENEQGINAFVAGISVDDVVMVVTRGALEKLNREALQGVIGHEFSHIFHGDMRINVRLIGLIAGISIIGQVGHLLLRSGSRSHRYSRRDKNTGGIVIIGLALFVIGYIGLFFGRLIKSAISRQREFLADASSVQYTRNKEGIANALTLIMYDGRGSHLDTAHAEDIAHMCFGESLSFSRLFATHPPLKERIDVVFPGYLAQYKIKHHNQKSTDDSTSSEYSGSASATEESLLSSVSQLNSAIPVSTEKLINSVGTPEPENLNTANRLLQMIPDQLHLAAYHEDTARAVIYAMLFAAMKTNDRVFNTLKENEESESVIKNIEKYTQIMVESDISIRLPLIELSVQTLRDMDAELRNRFMDQCIQLASLDNKTSMFEFVLITILRSQLTNRYKKKSYSEYHRYAPVLDSLARLLSVVIYIGKNTNPDVVFEKSISAFTRNKLTIVPLHECKAKQLSDDLKKLSQLTATKKKQFIESIVNCIIDDGKVNAPEAEMLRAISMVLDAPMPPVIQNQL